MKVVVTGASGFIGRAVTERLSKNKELQVYGAVRRPPTNPVPDATYVDAADLGPDESWQKNLSAIDLVIHTAARVHVMRDSAADPLAEYRRVNVDGTMYLARQAAKAGVKRFIFLSSIKVNGDITQRGKPFLADDLPAPTDAYGTSKHEAELALQCLSQASDMEVVVIRPPLVYGPGVTANFLSMMRWVQKGWPVPLAYVDNRRSLVALANLVDFIDICGVHPAAANQVFLVSDGEDVSTTELLNRVGIALQKPVRFVPVPTGLIRTIAALIGKKGQVDRLLGSLQVDAGKARKVLDWSPVMTMEDALQDTARYFLDSLRR